MHAGTAEQQEDKQLLSRLSEGQYTQDLLTSSSHSQEWKADRQLNW